MQRPTWLRWQRLRLSGWLTLALLLMALPSLLLPLVREGSRLFEGSLEEPLRLAHRMVGEPSPPWLVGYLLATQALLVWFTYFSRSARVKDSDKFAVFLLMCVAAISWFETLAQWLARR